MTERNPESDAEKAAAMVAQCESQLRQARETTRRAGVMLRRAERAAELAAGELGDATRRLERVAVPRTAWSDGRRNAHPVRQAPPAAPGA